MRVVQVCPYSWDAHGGVQVHVRNLAASLAHLAACGSEGGEGKFSTGLAPNKQLSSVDRSEARAICDAANTRMELFLRDPEGLFGYDYGTTTYADLTQKIKDGWYADRGLQLVYAAHTPAHAGSHYYGVGKGLRHLLP
jgi:hypothetical protein